MAKETTIDLTNFKDRVGQRVTPGRYRVVVEDTEIDKAQSGNTMFNLWLRIVGGEFDGSTIIDRLVQTENSLFRTVNFLQAIGYPTPKKRIPVDLDKWVGKTLDIDVEDGEPFMGRVKSEVRGYLKISGPAPSATADDEDDDGLGEFATETTQNPEKSIDLEDVDV